jgi:hypothetical protein
MGSAPPAAVLLGATAALARVLRGEWYGIVVDPVRQLLRRGLPSLALAFTACLGVIFFHALAQHPSGEVAVRLLGGVRGDLPLWLALLRTPVSLYVPALDLPVWAGLTQLFLAFALAELALGRGRTLVIAYTTTLAGTLTVRLMIALGPGGCGGLGLPASAGHVLDTGPSAAVVGLFTYLAVVRRAPVVFTLTSGSMVWESVAVPNLAGGEHLIAVAMAVALGLAHGRCAPLLRRAVLPAAVRRSRATPVIRGPLPAVPPVPRTASPRRPVPAAATAGRGSRDQLDAVGEHG